MPNRIIREQCRASETLDALDDFTERTHWRLTTIADDFGRFVANSKVLASELYPLRFDRKLPGKIEASLQAMARGDDPLLMLYTVNGKRYGQYRKWLDHNRKRAIHSKHPAPPDNTCQQMTTDDNVCGSSRDTRSEKREARHETRAPSAVSVSQNFCGKTVESKEHKELVSRVLEWHLRPCFKTKTAPQELGIRLLRTVKKHGVESVRRVFEFVADGSDPHPNTFWAGIKTLKGSQ